MGSTRLPGKVLKDLAGDTVLARVVKRTRRAKLVQQVVVATSDLPADDAIAEECRRLSVACFRGDEVDVLDRYYRAAQQFSADGIVRITSDCPLIDPELIDATVRAFLDGRADYSTNALVASYPCGLDVEVFTFEALARAEDFAKEPYQRTHVTPYFYENPGMFHIASLSADADYSDLRWTLDTTEDLEMLREVYDRLEGRDLGWREVLTLIKNAPELARINSNVHQKELHEG
jgi:spore coat polysaccharide biosynthesis protein SpsF